MRRWHPARVASGPGPSTVAKAYRLLKTILNTAVADELVVRNPFVLHGAASERTPERRPPTLGGRRGPPPLRRACSSHSPRGPRCAGASWSGSPPAVAAGVHVVVGSSGLTAEDYTDLDRGAPASKVWASSLPATSPSWPRS